MDILRLIDSVFKNYYDIVHEYNISNSLFKSEVYMEWEDNIINMMKNIPNMEISGMKKQTEIEKIREEEKRKSKEYVIGKVFKKIAKMCHPDKIDDECKINYFRDAKEFYNNSILIGVIYISNKLLIDTSLELKKPYIKEVLEKEIDQIQKKIDEMTSSYCWKWKNSDNIISREVYKNEFVAANRLKKRY